MLKTEAKEQLLEGGGVVDLGGQESITPAAMYACKYMHLFLLAVNWRY